MMKVKREDSKDIVMIKEDEAVVKEEEKNFDSREIGAKSRSLESCVSSHIINMDVNISVDDESVSKLRNLSTFPPPLTLNPSQKVDLPSKSDETSVLSDERSNTNERNGEELIPTPEEQLPQKCQICGQDSMNNTRSMIRFLPTASAKSDITLHVFCGKIASILPQIAQPHLEILIAAGLKNKYGIGPYVNFALARTRSEVAVGGEAEKDPRRLDKQYYLVQEFEENLKSIRGLELDQKGIVTSIPAQVHSASKPKVRKAHKKTAAFKDRSSQQKKGKQHTNPSKVAWKPPSRQSKSLNGASPEEARSCTILHPNSSTPAHTGLNSTIHLSSMKKGKEITTVHQVEGPSSRIRCPCGGSYKNPSRSKAHLKTPRHVLWESQNASARNNDVVDRNQAFNVPLGQQSSSRELEQTSVNGLQQTSDNGLQQTSDHGLQQTSDHGLQQTSDHGLQEINVLGLQHAISLGLQQTNSLGLQQPNSLGLQQPNSFGLQQPNSFGLLQQANSLGLQQANSLRLQQANSLRLQQANSLGLQEANFHLLKQALKNQGNLNFVQLHTMLEQESNRSLLQSHSDHNPSINNIPHIVNNASQVNNMDELCRQLNNTGQVNNMDELRRQLTKAMLKGSNVGVRQERTNVETNSQPVSPLLVLLLLLSQKK